MGKRDDSPAEAAEPPLLTAIQAMIDEVHQARELLAGALGCLVDRGIEDIFRAQSQAIGGVAAALQTAADDETGGCAFVVEQPLRGLFDEALHISHHRVDLVERLLTLCHQADVIVSTGLDVQRRAHLWTGGESTLTAEVARHVRDLVTVSHAVGGQIHAEVDQVRQALARTLGGGAPVVAQKAVVGASGHSPGQRR
jgi:hypothetical protein